MRKTLLLLTLMFCMTECKDSLMSSKMAKVMEPVKSKTEYKVTATMYYAVPDQCDDSPLVTACGYKINPKKATQQKWIAVSRDLLKFFKYGDKVRLSNAGDKNGIYTIADTMNKRFKNKIDILETEGTSLYKLKDVVLTKEV